MSDNLNIVDDIEDLAKNDENEKRTEKNIVKMKKKKCCGKKETCCSKKKKNLESQNDPNSTKNEDQTFESSEKNAAEGENQNKSAKDSNAYNNIPGTQKVFLKTYGCSHNTSDSEYMMGLLAEYGYKFVEDFADSDICVINSCTVKNPSQEAFVNYVQRAKQTGKKVVVAGCVPQGDRNIKGLEEVSMIGVTQIDRIVEVVEETLKGNQVKLLAKKELPSLDLPKIRRNELIEIVPINTGCLGSCTYCKTKHARGKLGSYSPDAIVNSCLKATKEGVKEIWLTSEDTGAYGRDINTDLPQLVMEIIKNMPEDMMIRIGKIF
jgi:threonylcarbamoyladenosine tRNA methylthiotransferase CDKAL1